MGETLWELMNWPKSGEHAPREWGRTDSIQNCHDIALGPQYPPLCMLNSILDPIPKM